MASPKTVHVGGGRAAALSQRTQAMEEATTLPEIDRTAPIDGLAIQLYFWSRSPYVLAGLAALILTIAAGIGWWQQAPDFFGHDRPDQTFIDELDKPQPDMARVLELLAGFQHQETGRLGRILAAVQFSNPGERIARSHLTVDEKTVALAYADSLLTYDGEPGADLLWLAHQVDRKSVV